jgi:hypothetical protein
MAFLDSKMKLFKCFNNTKLNKRKGDCFMVKTKEDLIGRVFGRLMVKSQAEDYVSPQGKHYAQWICDCLCGTKDIVVLGNELKKTKGTKSCGCLQREIACGVKKYNKWNENIFKDDFGTYRIGYTTNTNKEFYIDIDDFDQVKDYCWSEDSFGGFSTLVAHISHTNKKISMHVLLGFNNYDHADRNQLNNRKYNLRPATVQENARNRTRQKNNTSGFTGVSWNKTTQKWAAYIKYDNKLKHLGYFDNKIDAVKIRLQAEKQHFGDFAPQRHLFEQYGVTKQTVQN